MGGTVIHSKIRFHLDDSSRGAAMDNDLS